MSPATIALLARLALRLGIVIAESLQESAGSDEDREAVRQSIQETLRKADAELEAHPGRGG